MTELEQMRAELAEMEARMRRARRYSMFAPGAMGLQHDIKALRERIAEAEAS